MIAPQVRVLERISWVAPFGIRFWDPMADAPIPDGVDVVVWAVDEPRVRVRAVPNPSGVHVLHRFPGLGPVIRGDLPERSPPLSREVVIEVRDAGAGILPVDLRGTLPTDGLFAPGCATSPDRLEPVVELFPGPTRPLPRGAVMRCELRHPGSEAPVRWALITARYRGAILSRSVSDADGKVTLAFPYPELAQPRIGSVPSPLSPSPLQAIATWGIELVATHSPAVAASVAPDYCALRQQAPARLLVSLTPATDLAEVPVALGREAIVTSAGESHLYLVPA
jgi:hypothetical protein